VLKSLLARNIMLMAVIVLLSQIMTVALFGLLVIRPQAERFAVILARSTTVMGSAIAELPATERTQMIARLNANDRVRIRQGDDPPVDTGGRATLIERQVLRQLAQELGMGDQIFWQGGGKQPLWVRLQLGEEFYWVSVDTPEGWAADGTLFASFAIALIAALLAGMALQRRINRPLRALASAVDAMPLAPVPVALPEDGPAEVQALARSFNAMTVRLTDHEADRTLMLAGISHDLKTPIAKLRLGLALSPPADSEVSGMLDTQLDRMERMLGQFLDFGRGKDSEQVQTVDAATTIATAIAALGGSDHVVMTTASPCWVAVRPQAFERVLVNLLRNATIHGAPPFEIAIEASGTEAQILVHDRGSGVPDSLLPGLIEPFTRANSARPSDGGAGLGLAIAARFAHDHGGAIRLNNRINGGFTAVLVLPLATKG
jgi:two-component system osmolarity sensor histidine kinase EnvZ